MAALARYDFRRPNKLSRDHARALQMAGEAFARQWTTVLGMSLRAVSQVTVGKIEQRSYDEYVQSLPNPTYLGILDLAPLAGTSLLHLPLRVCLTMVDRLVGGPGGIRQPNRPVTEIEAKILRTHLGRVLPELAIGFQPIAAIVPELTGHEANPQFAQVASANDMVVVLDFHVRVGPVEGVASLCIPFASLEPAFAERAVTPTELPDRDGIRDVVEDRLDEVPLVVSVRFGEVVLTAREVAGLRPGDLVGIHHPVAQPVHVAVAGVGQFEARLGTSRKRLAAQVLTAPIKPGQSRPARGPSDPTSR